jgi:hypothetical protein
MVERLLPNLALSLWTFDDLFSDYYFYFNRWVKRRSAWIVRQQVECRIMHLIAKTCGILKEKPCLLQKSARFRAERDSAPKTFLSRLRVAHSQLKTSRNRGPKSPTFQKTKHRAPTRPIGRVQTWASLPKTWDQCQRVFALDHSGGCLV